MGLEDYTALNKKTRELHLAQPVKNHESSLRLYIQIVGIVAKRILLGCIAGQSGGLCGPSAKLKSLGLGVNGLGFGVSPPYL